MDSTAVTQPSAMGCWDDRERQPPSPPTWVGLPNHFQSCRAGRKAAILGRFSTEGRRCRLASSLVVGRWTPSLFLGRLLAPAWALGGRGGVGCGGGAWAAGAGALAGGVG